MSDIRLGGYNMLPPVVKNLLIINGLFYLATMGLGTSMNISLEKYLALHYFSSPDFQPFQIITYMFMHSSYDFTHILFNMFALWMFGSNLENHWGPKRFLTFYMVAGIGAGVIQLLVMFIQFSSLSADLPPELVQRVIEEGPGLYASGRNYVDTAMGGLNAVLNTTVVGASGSVYGLLLAFGMMFPNALIYIYFLFPIKAKWFVVIFGAIELFSGIRNSSSDNVAHFAHLGGMLFGFIMIKIWQSQARNRFRIN
jgi:membrane associated rhomboid family serine protease